VVITRVDDQRHLKAERSKCIHSWNRDLD
jgi:hypothetical protein